MSTFDSTKKSLSDLLRGVREGKIQLPDFQRGWVWDDEHVRSLLVSIARSFPVGAVMFLKTGGDVQFQVRPVENVNFDGPVPEAETLILDGQQRLTSLTQVLALDKPVKTFDEKKKAIQRFYYIDIEMAIQGERLDEAFFAVDADRKIKSDFGRKTDLDLSTRELECRQLMFPCSEIFNSSKWEHDLYKILPDKMGIYFEFRDKIIDSFKSYQIPVIELGKTTSKEAVCLVFEKVNTGGVALTVFELITASFAAEGHNLRDEWFGSTLRKVEGRAQRLSKEPLLKPIENTDLVQAITLLHTYGKRQQDIKSGKVGKLATAVSAKRVSMLALSLADYKLWADEVEAGFKLAAKFLRKESFYSERDLPYRTQIVPLAAVLTLLKERWLEPKIYAKLSQWFWCGVLGELYGGAVETRIANDLEELLAWFDDDEAMPRTVYEAAFQPNRLNTLRSRNSAAYKGLNILVLRQGAEDFFWKAGVQELDTEDVNLDIHHIFPQEWCREKKIDRKVFDSIINKTPISYKANRMIGKKAPSAYLAAIQGHKQVQLDDTAMNAILSGHLIDPEALRANNFEDFMKKRADALLAVVGNVMGKAIVKAPESEDPGNGDDESDDMDE
jgi:hypothetical protein